MKIIELLTGSKKEKTSVFVANINFFRVRNENEVWLYFNNEKAIIAHISYDELLSKVKQL